MPRHQSLEKHLQSSVQVVVSKQQHLELQEGPLLWMSCLLAWADSGGNELDCSHNPCVSCREG